jgi:hypothetical protein
MSLIKKIVVNNQNNHRETRTHAVCHSHKAASWQITQSLPLSYHFRKQLHLCSSQISEHKIRGPVPVQNKKYVNVKVKLSMGLINCHAMKTYRGSGGRAQPFLTSELDGGEWSVSHPNHFTHRGKSPRYPLYRRLGGLHSQSECYREERNLLHLSGIKPQLLGQPACSLAAIPTKLSLL